MSNRAWMLPCCLALAACVSRAELDGRPCPCADGWRCCAEDNVCVPEGEPCPGEIVVSADGLLISGSVCTSTPEEVAYPVKILLVIDTSSSMMFTDPSGATMTTTITGGEVKTESAEQTCLTSCQGSGLSAADCASICSATHPPVRQAAAKALLDHFSGNPAVSCAIISFNSVVTVNGASAGAAAGGFTSDTATLGKALGSLAHADLMTDYDGALQAARQLLESDMLATSAVERARTKYVVMLLSDGSAQVQCKAGCGNDKQDIGGGITVDSWCDLPRGKWCETYNIVSTDHCKFMTSWFPGLQECQAYNTEQRILDHVSAIAGLKDKLGVGGLTFNTTLLSVPTLPQGIQQLLAVSSSSDKACQADSDCPAQEERCMLDPNKKQKLCKAPTEALLIEMAGRGGGAYRRFSISSQIDYLLFDYSSLFKPFGMTSLIATNTCARPEAGQLQPDSDGDGLIDALELAEGLKPEERDSDGDGYGDGLELRAHYDPLQASVPDEACPAADRVDRDGDGLNGCEERVLGTDPDVTDTDRDRIPDGLEFYWGTNPLVTDDKDDGDFDGALSGEEIAAHTDPTVTDASPKGYSYTVRQRYTEDYKNKCFDFTVQGVGLQPTRPAGENLVVVYFGEGPTDIPQDYGNFKAACVRVLFTGAGSRDPKDGKVTLVPADFVAADKLLDDLARVTAPACRGKTTDPSCTDPCKGAALP